jgi:hypothetical protein
MNSLTTDWFVEKCVGISSVSTGKENEKKGRQKGRLMRDRTRYQYIRLRAATFDIEGSRSEER